MTGFHAIESVYYPVSQRPAVSPERCGRSLDEYISQSPSRQYDAKEFVFAEGDHASHIYRVESGAIALLRLLSDGRRQILGFAYPGDFIGLGAQGEHIMNAQAIRPARIKAMPVSAVHRLAAKDPVLCFTLYQCIAEELAATRDLMVTTGHRSACERVAAFLVTLARRYGVDGEPASVVNLSMTRADIADFLGLTIETVSRTLTKLKIGGLIDLPQSARVILLDRMGLQKLADGADSE
jgi:CRP/FNR family transcriptional regulator